MVADNLDSTDSRSQDHQDSFLVSKNADDPELTLGENDMVDKDVVWKQMGTAKKGKGNFYKGGKWLRDVRVRYNKIKEILSSKVALFVGSLMFHAYLFSG